MGIKWQLKVIKTDGTVEEYLHTKVIGTIGNALGGVDQPDICIAEQLADVVTYFLYHNQNQRIVTANEILSIIKAVLTTTGYEEAAVSLSEHHFQRRLKRCRIEVISVDAQEPADVELLAGAEDSSLRYRWDKSRIVADLITRHSLCRPTARMIASMVEEKVFSMGVTLVSAGLIKQLVLGDTVSVLRAQRQLQTV